MPAVATNPKVPRNSDVEGEGTAPPRAMEARHVTITELSAEELVRALESSHRVGNAARLRFVRALRVLHESQLYLELGYSSVVQLVQRRFLFERSAVYDFLRVAKAIDELPRCESAYEEGRIPWTVLRLITQVATSESEREWLDFARERSFEELRAEVTDARAKRRDRPRTRSFGLPNVQVRMVFELSLEEQNRIRTAFEKVAAKITDSLGHGRGQGISSKDALLFIAERILEDRAPTPSAEHDRAGEGRRRNSGTATHTILYRVCPQCRDACVQTPAGPVEVGAVVVERVEGDARRCTISPEDEVPPPDPESSGQDAPNSSTLARKVVLRDGQRCSNPSCGRRSGLHAHHIVFRADGGRTALFNETTVCSTCHALIHAGLLHVEGDPANGLRWSRRADRLRVGSGMGATEVTRVPVYVSIPRRESTAVDSLDEFEARRAPGESTVVDSGPANTPPSSCDDLWYGLKRLGFSATEAKRRVRRAQELLLEEGVALDDEKVLTRALRMRC